MLVNKVNNYQFICWIQNKVYSTLLPQKELQFIFP